MNQLAPISPVTVPALVAAAGERASMRFLEFFAANIRNRTPVALMPGPATGSSPGATIAA
jgi:hypothetical protein